MHRLTLPILVCGSVLALTAARRRRRKNYGDGHMRPNTHRPVLRHALLVMFAALATAGGCAAASANANWIWNKKFLKENQEIKGVKRSDLKRAKKQSSWMLDDDLSAW